MKGTKSHSSSEKIGGEDAQTHKKGGFQGGGTPLFYGLGGRCVEMGLSVDLQRASKGAFLRVLWGHSDTRSI